MPNSSTLETASITEQNSLCLIYRAFFMVRLKKRHVQLFSLTGLAFTDSQMTQQSKDVSAEPKNMSLIPRIHSEGEKLHRQECLLTSIQYVRTHTNKCNTIFNFHFLK